MENSEPGDSIVEDLKDEIQASGLSYKQIEEEAGLSSGTISRFLKDDRDIGLSTAAKIATFLGLRLTRGHAAMADDATARKVLYIRSEVSRASVLLQEAQERLRNALGCGGKDTDTWNKIPGKVLSMDDYPRRRKRGRPPKESKIDVADKSSLAMTFSTTR